MKKSIVFVSAMLLIGISLQAQQIIYESSFEKAKVAAIQQQKPIAILITFKPPVPSPDFLNGLKDESVIEKFSTHFINYKVAREDTAASASIIRKYKVNRFPSFVFLDAKAGLLFSNIVFLSKPQPLLTFADKAIASSKEMSLVDYDSVFTSGNYSNSFLKNYIIKRQQAGLTYNTDLIEKYVDSLNITDLNNYAAVLFILKAGPLADGRAYKLAHSNKNITDSIFKTEPLADRVAMNNSTISNTLNSAIANKDLNRAYAAANFARGSWKTDAIAGQKSWQLKMLQYYKGIKDTANYLQHAGNYYDQYYMRISIDSIRKKDSLKYETAKNTAMQKAVVVKINDSTIRKSFSFRYSKNNLVAIELNNAAWYFYLVAGNNENHLIKAMLWSKRTVELEPLPAYYDTYAHLLYKLKFYDEAEAMQKKAMDLAVAANMDNKGFKEEYIKIKKRKL